MRTLKWIGWGVVVAGLPAALGLFIGLRASAPDNPAHAVPVVEPPGRTTPSFRLVGTASCSARGCHGGLEPVAGGTVQQNEYSVWATYDRHADAYRVLETERSQRIEMNLQHLPDLQAARPQNNSRCLNCHVHPNFLTVARAPELADSRDFVRNFDGVGCETCHGPAEQWLEPHTQWQGKTHEEKERLGLTLGMIPTKDLLSRARVCLGCHVGAPGREVNHDLIAAGHPRLDFEFAAFLADMPKHWVDRDKDHDKFFEARAWAVGQAVTAQASLDLLACRARDKSGPWPEFTELDCYACHHNLQGQSWRQERGHGNRKPGSLPWSRWYTVMPRGLARTQGGQDLTVSFDEISRLIQQPGGKETRKVLADKAENLAEQLRQLQEKLAMEPYDRTSLRQRFKELIQDYEKRPESNWDEAAQLYLALAALGQADRDSLERSGQKLSESDESLQAAVLKLAEYLQFPALESSPENALSRYDSPEDFVTGKGQNDKRTQFGVELKHMVELLGK